MHIRFVNERKTIGKGELYLNWRKLYSFAHSRNQLPMRFHLQYLLIACLFCFSLSTIYAQKTKEEALVEPILLDKAALSGIGLQKLELEDDPDRIFMQKRLYRGKEFSVYMLSISSSVSEFPFFPFDEFVYLVNGRAHLLPSEQEEYYLNAGDFIVVPRGYQGNWEIQGGNAFNLELSIITNKRADSTAKLVNKLPFSISKEQLSGTKLTVIEKKDSLEIYHDEIFKGPELTISLEAETSREVSISNNPKEQFFHILSGMLELIPLEGEAQSFYTGDFLILPEGFSGIWKSRGQHLLRTLKVIATD